MDDGQEERAGKANSRQLRHGDKLANRQFTHFMM
jgi:hypothetical protein